MPLHDWTRVSAGTFHDFHGSWITHIKEAFNGGVLPDGFYAMTEQHAGQIIPDVLTLRQRDSRGPHPGNHGALAVAEAPPKTKFTLTMDAEAAYHVKQRTLAIRHASTHELIAILEIVSSSNKDRPAHVEDLARKILSAFDHQIHVLLLDLIPPGPHDPAGVHGIVWDHYGRPYEPPAEQPLTMTAYALDRLPIAYVEPVGVGEALMEMPLFLDLEWYVNTPLEQTYAAAFRGMPGVWKDVLEA